MAKSRIANTAVLTLWMKDLKYFSSEAQLLNFLSVFRRISSCQLIW